MRKTIFILALFSLLTGCAETDQQDGTAKTGGQTYKGLPVELHLPDEKPIPIKADVTGAVKVQADQALPVRLQMQKDKTLPVEVKIKNERALAVRLKTQAGQRLPVELEMNSDTVLPVEIKISRIVLVFAAGFAAIVLLIAVVTCFAAHSAARSAGAACQSADALKGALRNSEIK